MNILYTLRHQDIACRSTEVSAAVVRQTGTWFESAKLCFFFFRTIVHGFYHTSRERLAFFWFMYTIQYDAIYISFCQVIMYVINTVNTILKLVNETIIIYWDFKFQIHTRLLPLVRDPGVVSCALVINLLVNKKNLNFFYFGKKNASKVWK